MSTAVSTPLPDPSLYDKDFYAWLFETTALLRQGRYAEVDVAHIVEELEDMGQRERRAVENHIRNVVLHLLKWRYQPDKRGASWRKSIRNGRIEIQELLKDSPSLTRQTAQMLTNKYPAARADAVDETELGEETFPGQCPFTVEQILDAEYWGGVKRADT